MAIRKTSDDTQAQHARFVETVRALGCDESEEAFDEKLKAVVGPKPLDRPSLTSEPAPLKPAKKDAPKQGND